MNCRYCPYTTMNQSALKSHVESQHPELLNQHSPLPSPTPSNTNLRERIIEALSISRDENVVREIAPDLILQAVIDSLPKEHPAPGFHPEFNQEKIGYNNALKDIKHLLSGAKKESR